MKRFPWMPRVALTSRLSSAGLNRLSLTRRPVSDYGEVMRMKEALPMILPDIGSLRDYGGCYLVHGRYLLHATTQRDLAFASMIDINPTDEFVAAAREIAAERSGTRIETIRADFRDAATFADLEETDASLPYEVLLHQENYVDVMRHVCGKTKRFVCVAQPCLREELFDLPAAAVLLQFYDEKLKDALRAESLWPPEPRTEEFTSAHWMWGHTSSHLVDVMRGLGWVLREGTAVDNLGGPYWEYSLLVFERRSAPGRIPV